MNRIFSFLYRLFVGSVESRLLWSFNKLANNTTTAVNPQRNPRVPKPPSHVIAVTSLNTAEGRTSVKARRAETATLTWNNTR